MVPVVRSTFRILEELGRSGPLGLNEITLRTGVSKSTVFRILTTLNHLGYVIRDSNRTYCNSPTLRDLITEEALIEVLKRLALPQMVQLRDRFGETVNLGRLQFDRVQYLEVVPSEFALRLHERPGATVSIHASALGKAILAFMPREFAEGLLSARKLEMFTRHTITDPKKLMAEMEEVRRQGYAFDRGESSALATCVAAPILGPNGEPVAALSISGPTSRFNPAGSSPVIDGLILAAAEISRQLKQSAESSFPEPPVLAAR
jgi:IclR family acetate operon transcriptional repressor